jgi:hypothetical protein
VNRWESRKPGKTENMGKVQDRAAGAALTDLSSGVTVYIYVAIVLER